MEGSVPGGEWRLVYSIFERHRSIRRYVKKPMPEDHVSLIIGAAQRAPTDATLHLWSAIRVTDDSLRASIARAIGQDHVYEASEFFIFLIDLHRLSRLLEYRGERLGDVDMALVIFAAIDAALAAENMAIMAEALGYGTCFIGGVQNAAKEIIELARLPPKTYPLFGLTIGYPAEDPAPRPRLPVEMLVHENQYREYSARDLERAYGVMAPYSRKGDWLRILRRYVGPGGYFEERNRVMPELMRLQGFRL